MVKKAADFGKQDLVAGGIGGGGGNGGITFFYLGSLRGEAFDEGLRAAD